MSARGGFSDGECLQSWASDLGNGCVSLTGTHLLKGNVCEYFDSILASLWPVYLILITVLSTSSLTLSMIRGTVSQTAIIQCRTIHKRIGHTSL